APPSRPRNRLLLASAAPRGIPPATERRFLRGTEALRGAQEYRGGVLDRIPTRVVDVLVAVVVAAATLGNRLAEGHDAVAAALAVAISFVVVVRRRHPIVVLATLSIAS